MKALDTIYPVKFSFVLGVVFEVGSIILFLRIMIGRMSTRQTRSRRSLPQITRRKTSKKQRGGFIEPFVFEQRGGADMKVVASDNTDRKTYWQDVLEEDEDLRIFLEDYGVPPTTDEEKKARLQNYLTILSRQDDLFTYALEAMALHLSRLIYAEKNGAVVTIKLGDYESMKGYVSFINSKKDIMMPYIEDVEKLVNFQVEGGDTKINQIKQEPLTTLLLFPWRVNNVFVQSLAKIMVGLKRNDETLTAIRAEADVGVVTRSQKDDLHDLLASQWESFAMSQAYSLTAKELRDGFYINQGVQDFKDTLQAETFWKSLAAKIGTIPAIPACKDLKGSTTYVDIVSGLYGLYKNGSLTPKSILSLYSDCTVDPDVAGLADTALPPKALWDTAIITNGVTLNKLLSYMDDTTLQFMLQLAYTIQSVENPTKQTDATNAAVSGAEAISQMRSLLSIPSSGSAQPTTLGSDSA